VDRIKVEPLKTEEDICDAVIEVMLASELPYYKTKDAVEWALNRLSQIDSREWLEFFKKPAEGRNHCTTV